MCAVSQVSNTGITLVVVSVVRDVDVGVGSASEVPVLPVLLEAPVSPFEHAATASTNTQKMTARRMTARRLAVRYLATVEYSATVGYLLTTGEYLTERS